MKVKVLKNYKAEMNDFEYETGEIIDVIELKEFTNSYAILHDLEETNILDWIPKDFVEKI